MTSPNANAISVNLLNWIELYFRCFVSGWGHLDSRAKRGTTKLMETDVIVANKEVRKRRSVSSHGRASLIKTRCSFSKFRSRTVGECYITCHGTLTQ